ncbi:hypothetical protein D8B26_007385 [Coccidioides posadasii str. Silveira]|uniref:Predicted protein n=1 Tax=Coccidioides posadasii (strain RMSCC 757 / Silveira) TaxID=443226 RepID=E9CUS4_COCPS|nr:predicted protein [Coccidioides posadasii str. Silveira]QVM12769.1 hypothetical protein D8B26_007385 [Coccidioides posadasii str. Silveira]
MEYMRGRWRGPEEARRRNSDVSGRMRQKGGLEDDGESRGSRGFRGTGRMDGEQEFGGRGHCSIHLSEAEDTSKSVISRNSVVRSGGKYPRPSSLDSREEQFCYRK